MRNSERLQPLIRTDGARMAGADNAVDLARALSPVTLGGSLSLLATTRSLATLAVIATIEGCASVHPTHPASTEHEASDGIPPLRRERDRLTADEIAATPGLPTAYAAVEQLRREFLQPRRIVGAMTSDPRLPDVFVNNASSGGVEALRLIPIHLVAEIRFLGRNDAYQRFGSAHPAGVILVTTRR
jgi:hypothetical protein